MKKILMIAMCLAVMIAGTDVAFAKVKAKKQSRKRAATTAVAPAANLDFRGVLTANIGKKYNTQLMRNLMNSSEFVERGGYASFKPQVERLAGDVTEHQLGGAQVLMLRFGDMRTPGTEQIVFYRPSDDKLVTTTLVNSETWGDFKAENGAEPFLTQQEAYDIYWSTFTP
ncbi:MAG: hypothetical protein IJ835_02705 [Muribaculaceae bacterium]|nr:hypothetical protein [Muribaculaceae bacterium]